MPYNTQTRALRQTPSTVGLAVISLPCLTPKPPRTALEGGALTAALCSSRQLTNLSGTKDEPWRALERSAFASQLVRLEIQCAPRWLCASHKSAVEQYTPTNTRRTEAAAPCCNTDKHFATQYNMVQTSTTATTWYTGAATPGMKHTSGTCLRHTTDTCTAAIETNCPGRRRGPELGSTPVHPENTTQAMHHLRVHRSVVHRCTSTLHSG
jgi:hypothetical protein